MKNLFGVNAATNELNSEKFVLRKVSKETLDRQEEKMDELARAENYASSPIWVTIVMYLTFAFAIMVFAAFLRALADIGIEKALDNSKILLPIAGVCLVVAIVLFIFKRIRHKNTVTSSVYQDLTTETERLTQRGYDELLVPSSADEINVFTSAYKFNKNGKERNALITNFAVIDAKVFVENDCLCIADIQSVAAVPLSSITGINRVEKRVSIANWTKPEPPNSPKYKPYKIRISNGFYYVKPYYSLRFTAGGEEYEIAIPPYELEIIQKYVNAPLF